MLTLHAVCALQEMYHTTVPFDPEGVLSAINSVVMGFTGMQVRSKKETCHLHGRQ